MIDQPPWVTAARDRLGVREIAGLKHNPLIVGWLLKLGAWWRNDETPWCGVFVAAMLEQCGIPIPKAYYRAIAWKDWGEPSVCSLGAVAVLSRKGGGHVGFLVGRACWQGRNYVLLLGGNQDNRVSETWYPIERVLCFRQVKGTDYDFAPDLSDKFSAKFGYSEA